MAELRFRLEAPPGAALAEQLSAKLHFLHPSVAGARVSADGEVTLDLSGAGVPGLDRKARDLARSMAEAGVERASRVLDRNAPPLPPPSDPVPALVSSGELLPFDRARVGFGPRLSALAEGLRRRFEGWGDAMGCSPRTFPSLFSLADLHRSGHLAFFPHSLSFVGRFREDLEALGDYAARAKTSRKEGGPPPQPGPGVLADTEYVLAPAVCYHQYRSLSGSEVKGGLQAVRATGKCFRYESGAMTGLDRLWDFTMTELVFVGEPGRVRSAREEAMRRAAGFAREAGLAFTLETANDPFFIDEYAARAVYQDMFELKYELRLSLPHLGRDLAVGSFNYHQSHFGDCFSIRSGTGPAHTACAGFGLERWIYAVASQHGPDPDRWPAALRGLMA